MKTLRLELENLREALGCDFNLSVEVGICTLEALVPFTTFCNDDGDEVEIENGCVTVKEESSLIDAGEFNGMVDDVIKRLELLRGVELQIEINK